MEELNKTIEEQSLESEQAQNPLYSDELKEAVMARMQSIYNDGMIVGFQTACHTALDKIYAFERSAGKKSANDYKRCLKDLKKFFEIGISRKTGSGEETESEENAEAETAQN